MSISEMRNYIIHRYGPTVRNRLVTNMSDGQIICIYASIVERERAGINFGSTKKAYKKPISGQISLFTEG